jgi:hypothetical protein
MISSLTFIGLVAVVKEEVATEGEPALLKGAVKLAALVEVTTLVHARALLRKVRELSLV